MRATVLIVCAALVGGCHSPSVEPSQTTNERTSTSPPPEAAASTSPNAVTAIRRFVTAYINWSADTVSVDMRTLAARSVGQARAAMELAAAQTSGDYELRDGGVSNSGTVEAIAPLSGRSNEYVVVTKESTSATNTTAYDGLRPAWHVAVATVTELATGEWVLSGWQPKS